MTFTPIDPTTLALVIMLGALVLLIAGGLILHLTVRPMLASLAAAKQADVAAQRHCSAEARLERLERLLREEEPWSPGYGATEPRFPARSVSAPTVTRVSH